MVCWERYIQHGERVGEVQRRKRHRSVVGQVKEAMGKGLGRGQGQTWKVAQLLKIGISSFCAKAGVLTSESL